MSELPSIWRTELWHPMMVHFPIVLLLGAALLRILHYFLSSKNARFTKKMSRVLLYVGAISVWVTIYTGTLADSIPKILGANLIRLIVIAMIQPVNFCTDGKLFQDSFSVRNPLKMMA